MPVTEKEVGFDYEKILRAYIRHVGWQEGTYFLPNPEELKRFGLSDEEVTRLEQIADEVPGFRWG